MKHYLLVGGHFDRHSVALLPCSSVRLPIPQQPAIKLLACDGYAPNVTRIATYTRRVLYFDGQAPIVYYALDRFSDREAIEHLVRSHALTPAEL